MSKLQLKIKNEPDYRFELLVSLMSYTIVKYVLQISTSHHIRFICKKEIKIFVERFL